MEDWYKTLFDVDELVISKPTLQAYARTFRPNDQFFCLNPMANISTRGEDVACYRNILVEFDGIAIEEQWLKVVEELGMPFSVCTFSGSRSLHFIISLEKPATSLPSYQNLVNNIYTVIGNEVDSACKNPSRLSRTPNALREAEPPALQELVAVRKRVRIEELEEWMRSRTSFLRALLQRSLRETKLARGRDEQVRERDGRAGLPGVYQRMLDDGALPEAITSRHEALMKFATWLKFNGYLEEEISAKLYKAQTSIGLVERDDVPGIMTWLERRR